MSWCPTRYPFQLMFMSFYRKMMGVTSGAGANNPSEAHEFTPVFNGVLVAQSLVFCVALC